MPTITKCKTCGFEGSHGFTICVGGITKFYHTADPAKPNCLQNSCAFYEYKGKPYKSLAAAWKVAREAYPNGFWRQGWDALILEDNPRKHRQLMDKWREEATESKVFYQQQSED